MEETTYSWPVVSLLPMAVSALAMLIVSSAWYSQALFGKAWRKHTGIRPGDIRGNDARRGHIFSALTAIITAYLLGLCAAHSGDTPMLFYGVVFVWIFVVLEQLSNIVWRRDPFALFLLQAFRSLATLLVGALVFYFWR
jgi:hypothetical protein